MTIVNGGAVSSTDVALQLYGSSSATVETNSDFVRRFVKQAGGITYPTSFHGKGWGMQMSLVSSSWNGGTSSNMRPNLMDKRSDGGKGPPSSSEYYLDSSNSWYGGVYIRNNNNNGGSPRGIGINGYFYVRNPLTGRVRSSISYDTTWEYGPGSIQTQAYLFGFSAGYLSGNRVTIQGQTLNGSGKGNLSITGNYQSSYRHVCVNYVLWGDNGSTSFTSLWDGSAS